MGFLDDVGDGLEGLYKDGKKQVGKVIDQNAHTVGGMLDFVGLHDAAHAVDKFGDHIADNLGAQIGEMQLGDSDDPKDLVHGDAKALSDSAGHLRTFHDAFQETGGGLQSMDSDHWKGQAADAFRTRFQPHPAQWLSAADACATAATALDGYSTTVTWAQDQAKQAIDAYNAAKKAHQQAQDAYNTSVDAYNKAAKAWNTAAKSNPNAAPGPKPTDPGAFQDPSTTGLTHARDLLRAARAGRDSAADQAAKALRTALAGAPAEPSFTQRMKLDAVDLYEGSSLGTAHLLGGVVKGGADIVKFGRALDPMDAYNVTHPATYLDHLNQTAAGLVHADLHPVDVVKSLVGSGWSSDPFEAGGKLFTNIALGVATDGAGTEADAALNLAKDSTESAATSALKNGAENAGKDSAAGGADQISAQDAADYARWAHLRDFYNSPKGPWGHLAKPADGIESSAIHAGSVEDPELAQQFLDDQYPWMREVNRPRFEDGTPGYNQNCSENVIAVNKQLDGIKATADPLMEGRWPDPARLGNPNATWENPFTYDNIIQDLKSRGEGSRGVVYISRSDGTAHVFNAINDPNGVVFLDGQIGKLARLEPADSIRYLPYR
ncbi:toxin glutamine deamidase domain-containing protein [Kitasatospora sp. NBC_01287]|uniref:putative T7SS-secreted protein n=1 Tax=Kitasatospora sp. NBC_01287 TaxID=2903573 RepID=UPI002253E043|nr:toxin glutamine deamidase domain-containing protein [Kitasatospora sp. NBC_01287]MCX4747437.1 toxin glutamine deamidase domain-containing protein [Kitasatospora sp. NBC_01287]